MGLFMGLLLPVVERYVAELGVSIINVEEHAKHLQLFLQLCMHRDFGVHHVVTRRGLGCFDCNMKAYKACDMELECLRHCPKDDPPAQEHVRVENDLKFLRICHGIASNDQDTVLNEFGDSYIGVDDLNLTFGTTVLGVAIAYGTPQMLELLLRSVRRPNRRHLNVYIHLAAWRFHKSEVFVAILLDRFCGYDTQKKGFAIGLLDKAISARNRRVVTAVMTWVTKARVFPNRLGVINFLYKRLSPQDELKLLNEAPEPSSKARVMCLSIPDFMLTPSYKTYLLETFDVCNRTSTPHIPCWIGWRESIRGVRPFPLLFTAVRDHRWIIFSWMLWAGADPRHLEGDTGLLDWACLAGRRKEVAEIVARWGWDLEKLEIIPPGV